MYIYIYIYMHTNIYVNVCVIMIMTITNCKTEELQSALFCCSKAVLNPKYQIMNLRRFLCYS